MTSGQRLAPYLRRALALSASAAVSLVLLPVQPAAAAAWNPYPQTTSSDEGMTYQINPSHGGSPGSQTMAPPLRPAWSVNLGGPVSYPLLTPEGIFVTATNATTNHPQLYALTYGSGAVAWGPVDLGGSLWANASYDNGRVFTINSTGQMQAFDAQTGALQWTTQLPGQSSFTSPPSGSIFGSNSDLVYTSGAGSGGTLYAVHEGTGALAWRASVMNGDHSTPVVTNSGIYVSYACAQSYDFEPLTGALLWHHATGCEGGGGKTAILYSGKLYVRDAIVGNAILDAGTGANLGTFGATVAPAFSGSTGFFLNGSTLQAVDLGTNQALWSFTGDGSLSTAPIVVNGTVYVGSTLGTIFGVDASTGRQSWSAAVGAPINAPDEQNASAPLAGLGTGGGFLAVPAGNSLTLFGSALAIAPGNVNFGVKPLGSTTTAPVGINNNFGGTVTISSVTASGDYSVNPYNSTCGTVLNQGQSCQMSVSFIPSAYGPRNGTLTINDSAPGSPHTIALIGGATPGPIDHLVLTPPGATMAAGGTQAYGAEGFDAYGQDAGDYTNQVTFSISQGTCTMNVCTSTKAGSQQVTAMTNGQTPVGGGTTLTVAAGQLDHIALNPATSNVVAGATQAFTTDAFDQYGNYLGSATAASTFTIAPDGSCSGATCTATVAGRHTVTATDSGKTATATLAVGAGPLDHLTLSPSASTVPAGTSQAYMSEAFDQYGNDLGSATAATTFTITPDGSCAGASCSATTAGPHTVTAADNGKTVTGTLTVTSATVDHITVTPNPASITAGASQAYTAEAFDQYGNDLGPAAGTTYGITPDGACTGASCTATVAGPHTVTATSNGKTATASLTVNGGALDHITISPSSSGISAGGNQTYSVEGFDQYNNDLGNQTSASTLAISPDGTCAAASCGATKVGAHTVTATNGGKTATSSLTVSAGSLDHISLTPASASIIAGGTQTYAVEGFDAYGNDLGSFTANSSFAIAPDGSCPNLAACTATKAGAHTVTATSQGKAAAASLTVNAGPATTLTVSPTTVSLTVGQTAGIAASATDAYGNAVSSSATTWSLSAGTPGTLSAATGNATTFTASTASAGTGTVTAHLATLSAPTSVRVLPAAPTGLTAAAQPGHKVALSWTAAAGDQTYAVYRKTGSGSWTLIKTGLTSTAFTDSGLNGGTTYSYYVTGRAAGLESAASSQVSATPK